MEYNKKMFRLIMADLYSRIKRNIWYIKTRLSIPRGPYEFFPISKWLNQLVIDHDSYSLLFDGTNTWIIFKKNNIKIKYLSQLNSVSSLILNYGNFEETELDLVESNLREGSVFFDVGANVGLYSITIAKKFENINIYAFEPIPNTIHEFKENIDKNDVPFGKIFLIESAVSDQNGYVNITTDFHCSNYLTQSDSVVNHMRVESVTIDSFVQKNDISKIDFIKIDIEGHEYQVLKGALESIKKFRPIILVEIVEKDPNFSDNKFEDPKKSISLLLDFDYQYYIIDDNSILIHKDNIGNGCFNNLYHNYIFYYENIKTVASPDLLCKKKHNC